MPDANYLGILEQHVRDRARRRGLTSTLQKMLYANNVAFEGLPAVFSRALYVGVGHGHDVLLNFVISRIETAVGVDPFIESAGNGDMEYEELRSLISEFGLGNRFALRRQTIQEFLRECTEQFDLIVISDVLHHIFETPDLLHNSPFSVRCAELFKSLRQICSGYMVISEVERFGLLPLMYTAGILKGWVDYSTKQPWQEWDTCVGKGGFRRLVKRNYVPYGLRWIPSFVLSGQFGLRTLCSRVYIQYTVDDRVVPCARR